MCEGNSLYKDATIRQLGNEFEYECFRVEGSPLFSKQGSQGPLFVTDVISGSFFMSTVYTMQQFG